MWFVFCPQLAIEIAELLSFIAAVAAAAAAAALELLLLPDRVTCGSAKILSA